MNIFLLLSTLFNVGEFPISTATGRQWYPEIAFGGDKYLVVWEDNRKTGNSSYSDIWGQFVSTQGTLIDTNFPICELDSGQFNIGIAYGDSNYLVVWFDTRTIPDHIYGRLVSYNGALLDTPFCISANNVAVGNSKVVWSGTQFLVIWIEPHGTSYSKIIGQFVSPEGELKDSNFVIVSKDWNQKLALSSNGENYLIIWNKCWGKSSFETYGQLIDSTGACIDTSFRVIEGASVAVHPAVAYGSNSYIVVSDGMDANYRNMCGQIVGLDGTLIDSLIPIAAESTSARGQPDIGWNGENYLVVWLDARNGGGDVYGQWVSPFGTLLDFNIQISYGPAFEYNVKIIFGDSTGLVIWSDTRSSDYDIYGRIISETGVEEESQNSNLKTQKLIVSPNPFAQQTVLQTSDTRLQTKDQRIRIYDISGKMVEETEENIVGKNLKAGIYFIKANGYELTKIVKLVGSR